MVRMHGEHADAVEGFLRDNGLRGRFGRARYLRSVASGFCYDRAFGGYATCPGGKPQKFVVSFYPDAEPVAERGVLARRGDLCVIQTGSETGTFASNDSMIEVAMDIGRDALEFRLLDVVTSHFKPGERLVFDLAARRKAAELVTAKGTSLLVQLV
jgi:hypothetical protein